METRPCVRVRDLLIELSGKPVYKSLNFDIQCGRLAVITGAQSPAWGALLHMMAGMQPLHEGSVELWGFPISSISRRDISSNICYLQYKYRPAFNYPVQEFVMKGCEARLKPLQAADYGDQERVRQILHKMQIDKLASRNSEYLTNAEHQKVHLARAFAHNAPLTILDEPVADLDETDQYGIMSMFFENTRKTQHTVIATMQNPHLGLLLADQLIILDQNGLVADLDRQRPDFETKAELALSRALPFNTEYKRHLGFDLPDMGGPLESDADSDKHTKGNIF
jgi:ABC-type cobalamin/Fe3+-siderophores transport system ATPase subunit